MVLVIVSLSVSLLPIILATVLKKNYYHLVKTAKAQTVNRQEDWDPTKPFELPTSRKVKDWRYREAKAKAAKVAGSYGNLVLDVNIKNNSQWTVTVFILSNFARRFVMAIFIVYVPMYSWA